MFPNIQSIQVPPKCTKTLQNKDVSMFVEECPNCQQVKAEHLKPIGLTQTIEIRMWKWEGINIDFVVGRQRLPLRSKTMQSFI